VLMQQMAPGKFSTAHYGFATALMGVGMMVPSMTSGFVSDWLGYQDFFVYILIAGIPSIVIAAILPIQEEVKDVELPEGTPGRVVKSAAWATALAAGSLYLFITFSGLVTGPVLFGEFISFTVVLVFVVLVVLGCALAVFSVRNALAARRVLCEQGQQVKNQSVLAMVLAAVAVVTWISCLGALLDKNAEMNATRAECTSQKTLAACEVVCQNDGDYATCQQVMDAHSQALDAKPDDSKAAARAYASVRKALEIACFTEEQVADCMALAEIYRNPSRYGAAGESVSVDLREAKRYYNKACLLGDPTGCAGVDKMRAAIEAEE
jgi:hypothetical protein